MVVSDSVVGERHILPLCRESLAQGELDGFADRRSGFLADVVTVQCIPEGGRRHACNPGERLCRIPAILDEPLEVDGAAVGHLAAHALLQLTAVEQGDLLRSEPVDSDVSQPLVYDGRHPAVALDGFLFEVQFGMRLEVHLDELAELHAPALCSLTGLALLLKEDGLPLYLFLYLLGGHARFGCVGHGSAHLFAVDVIAARNHEHITAVAFDDGRHQSSPP